MSTAPVTPVAPQSEVAALAQRHLTLTYGLVATLVLLMALMGFGGYLGVKAFDNQLARQEQRDTQYQADRRVFLDTLAAHDADRAAQAQKIADLEAQIAKRDAKPLPKPIQDGIQPNASAEQVKNALGAVYGVDATLGTPKVEPDGNVALSLSQGQQAVHARIEADTAIADLKDEKAIVSLQEATVSSLKTDLNTCTTTLYKANEDIKGYKKLAVRSRWQKFLGGAEKVGIFAAGAFLGHKL